MKGKWAKPNYREHAEPASIEETGFQMFIEEADRGAFPFDDDERAPMQIKLWKSGRGEDATE